MRLQGGGLLRIGVNRLLPGNLNEGRPPWRGAEVVRGKGRFLRDLAEHGGRCSTWGYGNWPHSGRQRVPFEAVQLANITWDTFFFFRALVPRHHRFLPVQ